MNSRPRLINQAPPRSRRASAWSLLFVGFLAVVLLTMSDSAAPAGKADFDHLKTGFPLTGKHAKTECESCHVRGIFEGTPVRCASCHERGTAIVAST